jgi:hypothetical protein
MERIRARVRFAGLASALLSLSAAYPCLPRSRPQCQAARERRHIEENPVSFQLSLTVNGTTAKADRRRSTLLVELFAPSSR